MKGHGHRTPETPTYRTWRCMKQRCLNKYNGHYKWYGGAGVKLDPAWHKFAGFLADMGERPEGHTLDRIDPYGDYTKANCRWADKRTQQENKRAK